MAFEKINEFAADKQKLCVEHDTISDELFREYGVNRGLRDINGKGVLTGLTRISKVVSFKDENGEHVPCDGELWYRGYNINTLIKNLDGFGFEKTGVSPDIRRNADGSAACGVQRRADRVPHASVELHPGRYNEGSVEGHHEFHDQEHSHAVIL